MKTLLPLTLFTTILAFTACNNATTTVETKPDTLLKDSTTIKPLPNSTATTATETEDTVATNATYYLVVTDTGTAYQSLRESMVQLHQQTAIEIDTMGRHYNAAQNLIALPDNDPDEIYAGDYFPRRYPGNTLSIEYLHFYRAAGNKTMAVVAGMYETPKAADSALTILKKYKPAAFGFSASIYIGCMH
jgi:hypothetical protein